MRSRHHGFTLIEIMIVVAIVAILAVIALPSFADQIRKSRRSEAISAMQDAQLRLERWRVDNPSFAGSGVSVTWPSDNSHYTFEISDASASGYTIKGTPQGAQAKDLCGSLEISVSGGVTSKKPADKSCW